MSRRSLPTAAYRPVISPTVEKLLLEIEGQAVKAQTKNAIQTRDYAKENIRRLKEIQDSRKKDATSGRTPTKAFPLEINKASPTTNKPSEPLLTSHFITNNGTTNGDFTQERQLRRTVSHQSVVHPAEPKTLPKLQRLSLGRSPMTKNNGPSSPSIEEHRPQLPHTLGTVPRYLIARKQQWKEEAEQKRKAALNAELGIPPGHTLMSDEERLETLRLLEKTRVELLQKLISLPVHLATVRSRNLKDELEAQLTKAEEGIKIFSRNRVLIKHDE